MAQVVGHLLSTCEALSSNPSTTEKILKRSIFDALPRKWVVQIKSHLEMILLFWFFKCHTSDLRTLGKHLNMLQVRPTSPGSLIVSSSWCHHPIA
jgi:hypothetical protein